MRQFSAAFFSLPQLFFYIFFIIPDIHAKQQQATHSVASQNEQFTLPQSKKFHKLNIRLITVDYGWRKTFFQLGFFEEWKMVLVCFSITICI